MQGVTGVVGCQPPSVTVWYLSEGGSMVV